MATSKTLELVLKLKDEATKKMKSFGGAIERNSAAIKGAGVAMAANGAIITGALGLSVKAAAEFETRLTDVSTLIKGDATQAMDTMKNSINDMRKSIPVTGDDLGASAYSIVSAGVSDMSDAMFVLEQSAKLGVAGLGTTAQASDVVTSAMNSFGLSAGEADKVANVFMQTVAAGKTDISQLASAFGAVAPSAAALGVTFEELNAATAAITATGLPTSQAQNRLRAAFDEANSSSTVFRKTLEELGVTNFEARVQSEGFFGALESVQKELNFTDNDMKNLFGSMEAGNAVLSILGSQNEAFTSSLNSMRSGADVLTEAFDKQKVTLASQIQIAKNAARIFQEAIGDALIPVLTKFLDKMKPVVDRISEWTKANPELVSKIVLVVAAIGGLMVVLGPLLIMLPGLSISVGVLGRAFRSLLSPFGLVGVAITVLGAAFAIFTSSNESLKKKLIAIWQFIKSSLLRVWFEIRFKAIQIFTKLTKILPRIWFQIKFKTLEIWVGLEKALPIILNRIKDNIVAIFTGLKDRLPNIWDAIEGIAIDLWLGLVEILPVIWNTIVSNAISIFTTLGNMLPAIWSAIKIVARSIFTALMNMLPVIWEGIKSTAIQMWTLLKDALPVIWESTKKIALDIFTGLKEKLPAIWEGIKKFVVEVFLALGEILPVIWEAMATVAIEIFTALKDNLPAIWEAIWNEAVDLWQSLFKKLPKIWFKIKFTALKVWNKLKNSLPAIWSAIKSAALAVWEFLKNALPVVWNAIKKVGIAIWTKFKDSLPAIWAAIKTAALAVWELLKAGLPVVWEAIKKLAIAAWTKFKDSLPAIWEAIKKAALAVWEWLKVNVPPILAALVKNLISLFKKLLKEIPPLLKKLGVLAWEGIKLLASLIWDVFKDLIAAAWDWAKDMLGNFIQAIKDKVSDVVTGIGEVGTAIKDFFVSLPGKALEWGKNLMSSFIQGIRDKIVAAAKAAADAIAAVADFLGFGSPTKKGEGRFVKQWGENMITSFTEGVQAKKGFLETAVSEVMSGAALVFNKENGKRVVDMAALKEFLQTTSDVGEITDKMVQEVASNLPGVSGFINQGGKVASPVMRQGGSNLAPPPGIGVGVSLGGSPKGNTFIFNGWSLQGTTKQQADQFMQTIEEKVGWSIKK